jgi:hypothetical protein
LWALGSGGQAGAVASIRALIPWMTEEDEGGAAAATDWSTVSMTTMDRATYDRPSQPFLALFARHTTRELFGGRRLRPMWRVLRWTNRRDVVVESDTAR